MEEYDPRSLPDVDTVEIVDLREINPNSASEYMQLADSAPVVKCDHKSSKYLAKVWRALTPGTSSRCHVPSIGLRFIVESKCVCEASVCWMCDNIFGVFDGEGFSYAFTGDGTAGYEPFLTVKSVVGEEMLKRETERDL